MKLVTIKTNSSPRLCCLLQENGTAFFLDLNKCNSNLPDNIISFLEMGRDGIKAAEEACRLRDPSAIHKIEDISWMAPVPNPGKILCLGLNYRDHAAEVNKPLPDSPTIFSKFNNCVIGHQECIHIPKVSHQIDYEAELAIVIGKRAKHVSETDAMDYIAGYTALNDVSARDYQSKTTQWTIGKIFDTFAPMGPALVMRDEIPDPGNLDISLTLNGKVMQKSNTRNLIFSVPFLVSYLSQVLTLEPGDVISTGTPAGVGIARKPPLYLKSGDHVTISIEKIGELTNPVIPE